MADGWSLDYSLFLLICLIPMTTKKYCYIIMMKRGAGECKGDDVMMIDVGPVL